MINYRSIASLNKDVLSWIKKLPSNIELVVGIPRSGLLVANLISLHMDIPLTDVEGLINGRVIQTGVRYNGDTKELLSSAKKILVVDDSVFLGRQMRAIRTKIEDAKTPHEVLYGAVYVEPGSQDMVDYFYDLLPQPRFFEWNVFHHGSMESFCVDIDGVLCRDPTEEENDDGEIYERFIQNIEPGIIPSKTIGWLVTCRLEKYRGLTEQWLAKHGVKYKHLIMMDFPDKETRIKSKSHAAYKAQVYKDTRALFFIESSLAQSMDIVRLVNKEVLCMETREVISPNCVNRNYHKVSRFVHFFLKTPREAFRAVRRHLFVR